MRERLRLCRLHERREPRTRKDDSGTACATQFELRIQGNKSCFQYAFHHEPWRYGKTLQGYLSVQEVSMPKKGYVENIFCCVRNLNFCMFRSIANVLVQDNRARMRVYVSIAVMAILL